MGKFTRLPKPIKVDSKEAVEKVLPSFEAASVIAFDTETTGLSRSKDYAVFLSLSDGIIRVTVWPQYIHEFKHVLEDRTKILVGHNVKFDLWMLSSIGIDIYDSVERPSSARVYDTLVMHAIYDDAAPHDLKSCARNILKIEMVPFNRTFSLNGKNRGRSLIEIMLDEDNSDIVNNYASLDAWATYKLYMWLTAKLSVMSIDNPESPEGLASNMLEYYELYELPFTKVLYDMERTGMRLDRGKLESFVPVMTESINKVIRWFSQAMNMPVVNPASNPIMCDYFFNTLGFTPRSRTATGAPQLDAGFLKSIAGGEEKNEAAKQLLAFRRATKQLGTYVHGTQKLLFADGRVHPEFNQAGARTGRLSAKSPNVQNQEEFIREAYIAPPGYKLLAADYGQLEMRILAHLSGEPTLCDAIISGSDVHSATAAMMFGIEYAEIAEAKATDDVNGALTQRQKDLLKYRKAAKIINFGLMYGQGANKLAGQLGCSKEDAVNMIKRYFVAMPKITAYFDNTIAKARDLLYCTTILGRRRNTISLASFVSSEVASAERKVKNSPIQGTAAEITRAAMLNIAEDRYISLVGARQICQVHDEIVLEVPEACEHDEEFNSRIRGCMEHPFKRDLLVPLEISAKYGYNWLEAK